MNFNINSYDEIGHGFKSNWYYKVVFKNDFNKIVWSSVQDTIENVGIRRICCNVLYEHRITREITMFNSYTSYLKKLQVTERILKEL
jgi:DNA-directed RNA polymerase subunit N (RpoN/RPB10)